MCMGQASLWYVCFNSKWKSDRIQASALLRRADLLLNTWPISLCMCPIGRKVTSICWNTVHATRNPMYAKNQNFILSSAICHLNYTVCHRHFNDVTPELNLRSVLTKWLAPVSCCSVVRNWWKIYALWCSNNPMSPIFIAFPVMSSSLLWSEEGQKQA